MATRTPMHYAEACGFCAGVGDIGRARDPKKAPQGLFARRDVRRRSPLQLFESPLATSRKLYNQTKKAAPEGVLPLVRPGDSNLWPLESEDCDIRANSNEPSQRFVRCTQIPALVVAQRKGCWNVKTAARRTIPKEEWSNGGQRPSLCGPQHSAHRSATAIFFFNQNHVY